MVAYLSRLLIGMSIGNKTSSKSSSDALLGRGRSIDRSGAIPASGGPKTTRANKPSETPSAIKPNLEKSCGYRFIAIEEFIFPRLSKHLFYKQIGLGKFQPEQQGSLARG